MNPGLLMLGSLFILSCTPTPAPTQTEGQSSLDPSSIFFTKYLPADSSAAKTPNPEQVLVNIKTTKRISSNHYSDLVVDSQGNSYIACFEKKEDGQDYVLILKISKQGKILWESGANQKGRATAITIDKNDHIWVLGVLSEGLPTDEQATGLEQKKDCLFIAQFSPHGQCTRLITNQGSAKAFNIHINVYDEILISGQMGSELSFGDKFFSNETGEDSGFIASFDAVGRCQWIKACNAFVNRILSDSEGDFYLCGNFHEQMVWERDTFFTTDRFDDDGFLLKIPRSGQDHWLRTFGKKGLVEKGYATRETAVDMVVNAQDQVTLCAALDLYEGELPKTERTGYSDMSLLQFDADGQLLKETLLARHIIKRAAQCMTQDQDGNIWVSGQGQNYTLIDNKPLDTDQNPQTFLLKFTADEKIEQVLLPKHGTNMAFRSAYAKQDRVLFSGHYQSYLTINDQTISNDGAHGLFFYGRAIKD